MRALLGQLAPVPDDAAANLARMAEAVRAHEGADLAVFPELFVSGYAPSEAIAWTDEAFGPVADAASASSTTVMFGFAELCDDGSWANSVGVVGADGSLLGTYRKTHLFGDYEQRTFVAGDSLRVFDTDRARVGTLICFDIEFPEPARALALAGTQLLVTCSANMAPYGPDHALASRARALDNRLPHVYVNRVGEEAGLTFVGCSRVIDQRGSIVFELGNGEQLVAVDVPDFASPGSDVDYLAQLRSDLTVLNAATSIAQGGD